MFVDTGGFSSDVDVFADDIDHPPARADEAFGGAETLFTSRDDTSVAIDGSSAERDALRA